MASDWCITFCSWPHSWVSFEIFESQYSSRFGPTATPVFSHQLPHAPVVPADVIVWVQGSAPPVTVSDARTCAQNRPAFSGCGWITGDPTAPPILSVKIDGDAKRLPSTYSSEPSVFFALRSPSNSFGWL